MPFWLWLSPGAPGPAAEQVFEKPEEDFNGPSFGINQPADFGRRVEQIGGDPQHAVAVHAAGAAAILAAGRVRRALHADQAERMVGAGVGLAVEPHDLIAEHAGRAIGGSQLALFEHFVHAVVAQPADVTAVGRDDAIEQRELGVAAIHHVQPVGLDGPFEHRPLVMFAAAVGGHVDPRRHVAVDFEMGVQPPLHSRRAGTARGLPEPRGLPQLGQRRDQRAVHERERLTDVVQSRVAAQRFQFRSQLGDNLLEPLGVKDAGRFRERAQGGTRTAEFLLDLLQFARLLNPA